MMLYLISDAARQVPCSAATLRKYEARGVIVVIRDSGGRRLITEEQIGVARAYMNRTRSRFVGQAMKVPSSGEV